MASSNGLIIGAITTAGTVALILGTAWSMIWAHDNIHAKGYDLGHAAGHEVGYERGKDAGYKVGATDGRRVGYQDGYNAGQQETNQFIADCLGGQTQNSSCHNLLRRASQALNAQSTANNQHQAQRQ